VKDEEIRKALKEKRTVLFLDNDKNIRVDKRKAVVFKRRT